MVEFPVYPVGNLIGNSNQDDSNELLDTCQQEISQFVIPMANTTFGQRLKQAFNNASNVEIARKIGVSGPAVQNYMSGRVPDLEKLLKIKALTNCDLDWLLSGNESSVVGRPIERVIKPPLSDKLRQIAKEQAQQVYPGAAIASESVAEQNTLELLIQVFIEEGLKAFGLVEDSDNLLDSVEAVNSTKLTFIDNKPTIDDRIRELIRRENSVSSVAQPGELRDIIRELIREEIGPKKVPVYPIEVGSKEETTRRKAG
jgi:transcriptional regulator with XRE-family HTH domain